MLADFGTGQYVSFSDDCYTSNPPNEHPNQWDPKIEAYIIT